MNTTQKVNSIKKNLVNVLKKKYTNEKVKCKIGYLKYKDGSYVDFKLLFGNNLQLSIYFKESWYLDCEKMIKNDIELDKEYLKEQWCGFFENYFNNYEGVNEFILLICEYIHLRN